MPGDRKIFRMLAALGTAAGLLAVACASEPASGVGNDQALLRLSCDTALTACTVDALERIEGAGGDIPPSATKACAGCGMFTARVEDAGGALVSATSIPVRRTISVPPPEPGVSRASAAPDPSMVPAPAVAVVVRTLWPPRDGRIVVLDATVAQGQGGSAPDAAVRSVVQERDAQKFLRRK